ncbi:unnamed protein product [Moneuplotes crassus]|uniref:Myb-like domain-containing protein n=1 Tax=Euplotes crassus TaxID=5936 RepID=A0AAD1U2T1_EUPCR|nr:unnamed protein product [Moneuplotes crassus]
MPAWTKKEDELFIKLRKDNPDTPMREFLSFFKGRTLNSLKMRWLKINPTYIRGRWSDTEKETLFEQIFDLVNDNIDKLSLKLEERRQKSDVIKEAHKLKQSAAQGYLGPDYKIKAEKYKPPLKKISCKRESKARVKQEVNKKEIQDCLDIIGDIQKKHKRKRLGLVKDETEEDLQTQSCLSETLESTENRNKSYGIEKFNDLPPDLPRKEFLERTCPLYPVIKEKWTDQDDYDLLEAYDDVGPDLNNVLQCVELENVEQVKQRLCSLLRWGAYSSQSQILPKAPLKSRKDAIKSCVITILHEITQEKDKGKGLTSKVKFECGANISDTDDSGGSEFSY